MTSGDFSATDRLDILDVFLRVGAAIDSADADRYERTGDRAVLRTIVEAAHFPPGDHSRHLTQKNRHTTTLEHRDGQWLIAANVVEGAWVDGDIGVLTGA